MQTKVIFRKFKDGDVIALFPEMAGTLDIDTCNSYMHIGQHGSASVYLAQTTSPASYKEYLPLLRELRQVGYKRMKVVKRFTNNDRIKRHNEIIGIK